MDREEREGRTQKEMDMKCNTKVLTPCMVISCQMSPMQPLPFSGMTMMKLGDVEWEEEILLNPAESLHIS
jgi:hypothetical protein